MHTRGVLILLLVLGGLAGQIVVRLAVPDGDVPDKAALLLYGTSEGGSRGFVVESWTATLGDGVFRLTPVPLGAGWLEVRAGVDCAEALERR